MEAIGGEVEGAKGRVSNLDACGVALGVEASLDREPGGRAGVRDEIEDNLVCFQRPPPPVVGDVAEHPMFDLVPLAGAGRIVAHLDCQSGIVSEILQRHLPRRESAIRCCHRRPQ